MHGQRYFLKYMAQPSLILVLDHRNHSSCCYCRPITYPNIVRFFDMVGVLEVQSKNSKPLIILVHGAWADGTGWQHVIPDLLDAGYDVTAVQLPLISLENGTCDLRARN